MGRGAIWQAGLASVVVLCLSAGSLVAGAAARRSACRVPRLGGMRLSDARERAAHAGCAVHLAGRAVEDAGVQTVQRQSPRAGAHGTTVTLWVNPLCRGSADAGGPPSSVKPGPTELITGFYLDGGPADRRWSSPGCRRVTPSMHEEPPGAGSVQVVNAAGAVVATRAAASGSLATISLPAGSYTVTGTFLDATINGQHPVQSMSVEIPSNRTVRKDFVLSIK